MNDGALLRHHQSARNLSWPDCPTRDERVQSQSSALAQRDHDPLLDSSCVWKIIATVPRQVHFDVNSGSGFRKGRNLDRSTD